MPEIDLPTVIFALVALFVAYKLRSVLGMRNNSERQPGGMLAPLRRVPGTLNPTVVPPEGAATAVAAPPASDRWKGVAEADPAVWSGLDAVAAADRGFSPQAFLSGARAACGGDIRLRILPRLARSPAIRSLFGNGTTGGAK